MKAVTQSIEETEALAESVAKGLRGEKEATILALKGGLGSGKTAFTKGIAKAFGIEEDITSPTFVIEKLYALQGQVFDHLVHIDAYRLESADELRNLDWDYIAENPKNCIVIEWPEKVAEVLPENIHRINFTFVDEETREIESALFN